MTRTTPTCRHLCQRLVSPWTARPTTRRPRRTRRRQPAPRAGFCEGDGPAPRLSRPHQRGPELRRPHRHPRLRRGPRALPRRTSRSGGDRLGRPSPSRSRTWRSSAASWRCRMERLRAARFASTRRLSERNSDGADASLSLSMCATRYFQGCISAATFASYSTSSTGPMESSASRRARTCCDETTT